MATGRPIQIIYDDALEIDDHVIFADATFQSQMFAVPGSFEIRCKDPDQTLSFVTGRKLVLLADGQTAWAGYITQIAREFAFPADKIPANPADYRNRIWVLRGVDANILLDKRVLRHPANYLRLIPDIATPVYDGEIITDHLFNYIDADDLVLGVVDNIHQFSKYAWKQQGSKLRETLDEMRAFTGALVYVGSSFELNYKEIDTSVSHWGFSDVPDTNPSVVDVETPGFQNILIGPRDLSGIEEITAMVNDAFVWGGGQFAGSGGTVFSRETNEDSIDEHSLWQYAETHFGEQGFGVQSGVDVRSNLIVNGSPGAVGADQQRGLKYPQWQIRATWFSHDVPLRSDNSLPDYLVPGMLVTFVFNVWGNPLTLLLPLRSVKISFPTLDPTGKPYVQYDGFFGLQTDDPKMLWSFILGAQPGIIETVTTTVDNDSTSAPVGSDYADQPSPEPDDFTTVFTIPWPYLPGSTSVYVSGLYQIRGIDYTESDPATGEFTFTDPPVSGDVLWVEARTA